MLPIRDPPQGKGHRQIESEGMEKYFRQTEMTGKQELQYSYQTK